MVHPWRGAGVYSNWSLYSTDHVLDGAPDTHVEPGEGAFPHGLQLSRWYRGLRDKWPLENAGEGARQLGARWNPLEYKGLDGAAAFQSTFGHVRDRNVSYAYYDNYTFDGVTSAEVFATLGHAQRKEGLGGMGAFDPYEHNGPASTVVFASSFGQAIPTGSQNAYGHNRVKEHRGVTSSNALNIT